MSIEVKVPQLPESVTDATIALGSVAATIVTAAEQEAERVAAQIGDEAQHQGHAEGFERGLAEGRKRGCEEAIASAAAQFEQLAFTLLQEIATDRIIGNNIRNTGPGLSRWGLTWLMLHPPSLQPLAVHPGVVLPKPTGPA